LPPRKLAWSESDCTSRSVDLKATALVFDSVTFDAAARHQQARKLTRPLGAPFEISRR